MIDETPAPERGAVSVDDLGAYVDGRLAPAERRRIERLLGQDRRLEARVAFYRRQRLELCALHKRVLTEPVPRRLLDVVRSAEKD
jgi:anti-sigma factor RsiW